MKASLSCILVSALALTLTAKEPFRPNLGPDLPAITVRCGEVTLMLRQASQWTPGRIDFRGRAMTTERSAYGTVFSFPDVGFIGTGHLENEPEPLTALAFFLDGKEVTAPAAEMEGKHFRFLRESKIRDFTLRCETEVKDGRVHEKTLFRAEKETPLKLVYHFMHAWTPTVSAYLAGNDETPDATLGGDFLDTEGEARKFHVREPVDWVAVHDPASGQFAVSRLLAAPEIAGNVSMIWIGVPSGSAPSARCAACSICREAGRRRATRTALTSRAGARVSARCRSARGPRGPHLHPHRR